MDLLVLSNAGKPIYLSNPNHSPQHTGVIQAVLSVYLENQEFPRFIETETHTYAFSLRGALYFVAISGLGHHPRALQAYLTMVHNQLIFSLSQIFTTNPGFDLASLLQGTESHMESLSLSFQTNYTYSLDWVIPVLVPLPTSAVGDLSSLPRPDAMISGFISVAVPEHDILNCHSAPYHVIHQFPIRGLSSSKLNGTTLDPRDTNLLLNMISGFSSTTRQSTWTPACLSILDKRNFVHVYSACRNASDASVDRKVWIVLLAANLDAFFPLEAFEKRISRILTLHATLDEPPRSADLASPTEPAKHLESDPLVRPYTIFTPSPALNPLLQHFIITWKERGQSSSPTTSGTAYSSREDWIRLVRVYAYASRMLAGDGAESRASVVHLSAQWEHVVAMRSVTGSGLVYFCAFNVFAGKQEMQDTVGALDRWASARKERLFLL
ncbi:MAG: hypothetical protein SGCHY_005318 [Lobulomycetales sp.]